MRTRMLMVVVAMIIFLIVASGAGAYQTATSFQFPLPNWNVGCNNFWSTCVVPNAHHLGEDVGASATTPVYACANGLVKEARSSDGYGGIVVIEHYTGTEYVTTITGHMKAATLAVSSGQEVSKGQLIGYVGTSAENGGWPEHVHFGVHKGSYQTGNSCDNHWVYAGYDYSGCTQNNWYTPTNFVNSHQATYSCSWHTQDPNTIVTMNPGQTRTFTVSYTNTGNTTWQNTGGVSNPNYIELRSCDDSGNVTNSWLYPGDGQGWINRQRVVTQNAANVQPGQNAWFIFTGKVPDNATPGDYHIYFRPYHATGGYISNWGGMNFYIRVISPDLPPTGVEYYALSGNWDGDYRTDIGLFTPSGGQWFVAFSTGDNHFVGQPRWLNNFGVAGDPSGPPKPLVGDFNGDNKDDIAVYQCYDGKWFVALNNGSSFVNSSSLWLSSFAVGNPGAWRPLTGEFNGDNKDDICAYEPSSGQWWVALSTGSSFSPNGCWRYTFGVGTGYQPIVGDFTNDSKDDIGVYEPSCCGKWFVAYGTGFSFAYLGSPWLENFGVGSGYQPVVRDFNNDGRDDICVYQPSEGKWFVALSTSNSFSYTGGSWISNFATGNGYVPFTGDFDYNNNGRGDVAVYEPSTGKWFVVLSTGTSFTYTGTYWLSNWGVGTAGSGKISAETEQLLPVAFSLSQNYPNPFNPTTTISYTLYQPSHVRIDIYNLLGQKISTLTNEQQDAGEHQVIWNAGEQPSGVYFYRIVTDTDTETRKMLLIK